MIKNSQSLKDRAKNIATKNGISVQEVTQNYMFERILERLSVSKYSNNFILKGGLLLSSIIGIDTRTTMDMDTCIKGLALNENQIHTILQEILDINLDDNLSFKLLNTEPIKEDDEYGGFKFKIMAYFDDMEVNLSIDVATGDIITPKEIEYTYKLLFEDRAIRLLTYNLETIIAEKFQTIISKNIFNSRMKDYYDLYYLLTYKTDDISISTLTQAIKATFEKRETDMSTISDTLEKIKKSDFLKDLWSAYSKKFTYANKLKYIDLINKIEVIPYN